MCSLCISASSSPLPQSSMGSLAPDSMVRRVYQCMCGIDPGLASPAASGKTSTSAASGVGREQMVVFLADTLRGTAEERAPLVMAMSRRGAEAAVTCQQVTEVSRAAVCDLVPHVSLHPSLLTPDFHPFSHPHSSCRT